MGDLLQSGDRRDCSRTLLFVPVRIRMVRRRRCGDGSVSPARHRSQAADFDLYYSMPFLRIDFWCGAGRRPRRRRFVFALLITATLTSWARYVIPRAR